MDDNLSPDSSGPAASPYVRDLTREEIETLPLQALLVRAGYLSIEQLSDALRENVTTYVPVEEIAVARGWVPPHVVEQLRAAKQPAAPQPVPVAEPAPAPPAVPPATPAPGNSSDGPVIVQLSLVGGGFVRVGRFATKDEGTQRAQAIMESLMRPEPGVWPRFGSRLVRPEAVVAVELAHGDD